jgi:hypothetical protein
MIIFQKKLLLNIARNNSHPQRALSTGEPLLFEERFFEELGSYPLLEAKHAVLAL